MPADPRPVSRGLRGWTGAWTSVGRREARGSMWDGQDSVQESADDGVTMSEIVPNPVALDPQPSPAWRFVP